MIAAWILCVILTGSIAYIIHAGIVAGLKTRRDPMQLDWHDLRTNGCPALLRALKLIETALTQQEARLSQQRENITELQYLISEEIMVTLTDAPKKPQLLPRQREVVAELGSGWQIVRQPSDTPAATTTVGVPGSTWKTTCPDWVTDYAAATDNR
jgi:hypothetical protein